MNAKTAGWTGISIVLVALLCFGTARADDTLCSSGDILTGSHDNISVEPPRCSLDGAELAEGASIDGSVQAEGNSRVTLRTETRKISAAGYNV